MKTKLLVLTLIATISMVVCPSVYSDNPPKKDKDLSTNGVSVGNAPLENFLHGDNLFNLESGFYYVFVWGETNQLLDCFVAYLDSSVIIPENAGYRITVQAIFNANSLTEDLPMGQ